jgi:hypothetical protein
MRAIIRVSLIEADTQHREIITDCILDCGCQHEFLHA